ncbi:MAG: peptidase M20 [Planctomycetaceae bacterium]|nr:peptidase M20 [Planctomycetaceae bacterium]|tara:strand:- start:65 stop:1444 length:1380 start_codon:yes stop_codon:yes gene_type:complete
MTMDKIETYLDENRQRNEDDLFELLRMASVSTDSQFQAEVERAGQWVAEQFIDLGFITEVVETKGHPIIYAQTPPVEGAPVVLVYGHYDVQPPDPLEEWVTPPFEPTVRDGNVYARGATDDKGQMLTHIKSAQAWMETEGSLPIQIKYVIEGEEECGSSNLDPFLQQYKDHLQADIAVISDTSQFAKGQPAITYGLKGIVYFEVFLEGPKQDLHSGTFGGAVSNPINALTQMLGKLVDGNGRIQIPEFYDDVIDLEQREREQFASLPFAESEFKSKLGIQEVFGECGYTTLERRWARPTCDINGIWGGYQGEGAKTVLPARAGAKFSCRLVPDQNPDKVRDGVQQMLEELLPAGLKMEVIHHHGAPGVVVALDSPYMSAAAEAIGKGFGTKPVFIREGGSIPVVTAFRELLGIDTLLLGWGLDDDNTHSPNEKFSLDDYYRGTRASAYLWHEISKIKRD